MSSASSSQITVAILGGNPMVGKALESLLRSADYVVRFFSEHLSESPDPLQGASIALILASSSNRNREALIENIRSVPATANLPIVELITIPNTEQDTSDTQLRIRNFYGPAT